eukprot:10454211-Karenia_brevis.AAC.1
MTRAISHSYLGSTATVDWNRYQCHLCLSVHFTRTARRCGECEDVTYCEHCVLTCGGCDQAVCQQHVIDHLTRNCRGKYRFYHGSPDETQTEICIDPEKGRVYLCSGFLPIPNYMVTSGNHVTKHPTPSDLSPDLKCRICNINPTSTDQSDECRICHRMPCKLQCRSFCPPCGMVVCSDCAPNHNKTCPRSRRDSTQGNLTISYPDSINEMLWSWSKPWLERYDG